MQRNRLYTTFLVLLLGCLIAYGLSEIGVALGSIGGYRLKSFDLLSDLLDTEVPEPEEIRSRPLLESLDTTTYQVSEEGDSISDTVVPILSEPLPSLELSERLVDYSEGEQALRRFRNVLEQSGSRRVRIAFVGDSFIEGDILVAPFRDKLQHRYGGQGVGYVPLTSPVARFRQTIQQRFDGDWQQITANKSNSRVHFTLAETYTTATATASTRYKLASSPIAISTVDRVSLHYVSDTLAVPISYGINGGELELVNLPPSYGTLVEYTFPQTGVKQLQLATEGSQAIRYYGVCFDGSVGVSVDNYSLRGSMGMKLSFISPALTIDLSRVRPYDLIILSYGLNVVSSQDNDDNYEWYYAGMSKAIEHLQELYPDTAILLMSLSNRATLRDGQIYPLNGVDRVLRIQHRLAQRYGLIFWNTHEAMASLGGIKSFVDRGWAAKDYTHISAAGGTQIADLLTADLLGYDQE